MSASRLRAIMGSSSTIKARRLPVGEELWAIWSSFPLVAKRSDSELVLLRRKKFPNPLPYRNERVRKGHSCEASRLQARPTLIRLRGKRRILIAFCQPKTWRHLNNNQRFSGENLAEFCGLFCLLPEFR